MGAALGKIGFALALAFASPAQAAALFEDVTPPDPVGNFDYVQNVAVHPLDGRRLLILQGGRIRTSRDGGATWSPRSTLGFSGVDRLLVHKGRPDVVFLQEVGTRRAGLSIFHSGGRTLRSPDFGETWPQQSGGYEQDGDLMLSPFASDPALPERILATLRTPAIFGLMGVFYFSPADISFLESVDGGHTWSDIPAAIPALGRFGILSLEEPVPAAPKRLFLTTQDNGAFVSLDGARTWSAFRTEFEGRLFWIRQDPLRASVLYASGMLPDDRGSGVLRSDDGGNSWRLILPLDIRLIFPLDIRLPTRITGSGALTIDPVRTDRLWLTGLESGVFLSEDGGASWTNVGFAAEYFQCNCVPYPADPATVVTQVVPSQDDSSQAYLVWKGRLFRGAFPPRQRIAVEYRYGENFWITGDAGEAISQDYRANQAVRTGERFGLWSAATAPEGAVPICRFQGNPARGQHSRFLTTEGSECESLKGDPGWVLEGEGEYFAMQPGIDGSCTSGLVSVRRFVNTRGAFTNHRYVAGTEALAQMRASDWIEEGTAMCARPLGNDE